MAKITKNQTVTIKTNEENPEPVELIARAIVEVSNAFEKLQKSRLSERAILVLIYDQVKDVPMVNIRKILEVVPKLKDIYLKKISGKK